MDRGSTTAFQQEVVKSANRPVHLAEVIFDDEFDCEIHDYGKMKIEPQEEKNEH